MSNGWPFIRKMLSFCVSAVLLMGLIAPIAGIGYASLNEDDTITDERSDDLGTLDENTRYIEGTEYINNTDRKEDNNIVIDGDDAHLKLNNATLTLLMDDNDHMWNISVRDGGRLSLWNSTIRTSPEQELLRPFLKTDVTVSGGSHLSLQEGSSFRFPGFVNIDNSDFEMIGSNFEALDDEEIPEYDYLWGGEGDDIEDNNDGPRLIVENGSDFYMEDSEINDYYTYDDEDRWEMTWYPLDDDGVPIERFQDNDQHHELAPGEEYTLEKWFLYNPMVDEDSLEDYPYINPIDMISSLGVEATFEFDGEYEGGAYLEYESPQEGEWVEVFELDETENQAFGNIWETELSEFYEGERDDQWRYLHEVDIRLNNQDNDEVNITELRLVSTYDNDIHIWDSDFTAINSFIDVDIRESDVDSRQNEEMKTDGDTYLPNSNVDHRVLRVYDSTFRSYGLSIDVDDPGEGGDPEGDPWILNTEDSWDETLIYRWVDLQITTEAGTPLPGATVEADPNIPGLDEWIEGLNDLTEPRNERALDYLEREGNGTYEDGIYEANEEGRVSMLLAAGRINYPEDWPNSRYLGTYDLNLTYEDPELGIWENATQEINLDNFPHMENPEEWVIPIPIKFPDFQAGSMWVMEDEITPGDEVDVHMEVFNIGERDAENVEVSFYEGEFDEDNPGDNLFGSTFIDDLPVDDSREVSVSWEASDPGDHDLVGMVDPENNIPEMDRDNNEIEETVTVLEEAEFEVDITEPEEGDEFVEGETVTVDYTVTNTGEAEDTQNIEFYVDEDHVETGEDVTLGEAEVFDGEFTWVAEEPYGERDLSVQSEDYQYEVSVTVLSDAEFTVNIDEDTSDTEVVEGEDLEIEVEVENIGEVQATQMITLYDTAEDSIILDEEQVTIEGESSDTITLTWETQVGEAGDYILEVASEDDDDRIDVTVLEDAYFEVEIEELSDDEVVEGEEIEVTYSVTNTGEASSTQTIDLRIDGDPIEDKEEDLLLGPGEDYEGTFTWQTEGPGEDREMTVQSDDDSDGVLLTILKDAYFEVEITEPGDRDELIEGQEVTVEYYVENIGDVEATQDIVFEVYDQAGNLIHEDIEEEINLHPELDDPHEGEFIWTAEISGEGDREMKSLTVSSEQTDHTTDAWILSAPRLEITEKIWEKRDMDEDEWYEIDFTEEDLEEKDKIRFRGSVENTGQTTFEEIDDQGLIHFDYPDGTSEQIPFNPAPGEEEVVESEEWTVALPDDWDEGEDLELFVNSTSERRLDDEDPYYGESFDISITPLEIDIVDIEIPDDPTPGGEYSMEGRLVRAEEVNGKPLEGIDVEVTIESNGEVVHTITPSTDSEGNFFASLSMPEEAGDYTISIEVQTFWRELETETVTVAEEDIEFAGIPLWLFIVIVAAAAGGVGSIFAYFKFFGPKEVVECGNCGTSISAEASTCPNCGVEFDMETAKCSECGEWIPATSDTCPECGAEFIKTGEEVQDYTERMRQQYERFVEQRKEEAEDEVGRELSKKEFVRWWKQQPSFVTFDEWLERKEKQRKEGGQECPNCGTLNSVEDAVCQKCGTSLIELDEKTERRRELEEDEEELETSESDELGLELEEERIEEEEPAKDEKEKKKTRRKKVKKKPKKKVKKKVVKNKDED